MTDEEQMDDYIERALQLLTERTKKPCVDFRLTDSDQSASPSQQAKPPHCTAL